MKKRIALVAALLAAPALFAEQGYYRIDYGSSGSTIASDKPVSEGAQYLFHQYPSGTLVSVRQDDVKTIVPISARDAEKTNPARRLISIGNLAMQGGSSQAGLQNASSWNAARTGPSGGSDANPWSPGATWAFEPANAVVASPGAPPMAPR
ncbi:MAG: hypothetical protein WAU32_07750 [Thermoanaerobaculia bacterium]|jgi:hypothetical protein